MAPGALKLGLLFPAYKDDASATYLPAGNQRLIGALLAIDEINASPTLLPNTPITFSYLDSRASSAVALQGALQHATSSFANTGADAVIGPASSSPTINAQLVLKTFNIPQISYSATSPDLSDNQEYPTFFRTVASDAFQGAAIASFLADSLSFSQVCVLNGLDSYSAKGADAFISAANELSLTIRSSIEVPENPSAEDAENAVTLLAGDGCRVIFMMTQASAAGTIVRSAANRNILGKKSGYLWVFPDAITSGMPSVEAYASVASIDPPVPAVANLASAFEGSIGSLPLSPSGSVYENFLASWSNVPSSLSSCGTTDSPLTESCTCAPGVDIDLTPLYQHDHDRSPATPPRCTGFDPALDAPGPYTVHAYDAVYAVAHAAQTLVTKGVAEFDKDELMDALRDVTFEGVTGIIDFEESGDREAGVGFTFVNHMGASEFTPFGDWTQDLGLVYKPGMNMNTILWPTSDGGIPEEVFSPDEPMSLTLEIVIILLAVFVVGAVVILTLIGRNHRQARVVRRMSANNKQVEMTLMEVEKEVEVLQFNLRKMEHSEEELEVMKRAMDELSHDRQDELRGCLIDSKEVKVDHLLGKGGFGVVNLADYRGEPVAMKQLLDINDDSVKRFRFECFLMKSLRHPNIVKLIGVCWDDNMFACCLEYVENGTLEDWLRKGWGKRHNLLVWKDRLFVTALECAEALQYLHNERYYSEDANGGEGAWRECIIHRDLKPDNMLLTKDWQLKLTDFGEARAVEQNQTMTSVGTPIYVAPEIMRANRYDSHADVYSFSVCIVAMIRGERNLQEFYMQALRKQMKRKSCEGMGVGILNNRLNNKGWRPLLPLAFEQAYPLFVQLIKDMWHKEATLRPDFKTIVNRMRGEIRDEIRMNDEPDVVMCSLEDDAVYRDRLKGGVGNVQHGKRMSFIEEDAEEGEEDDDVTALREELELLREALQEKEGEIKRLQVLVGGGAKAQVTKAKRRWSMLGGVEGLQLGAQLKKEPPNDTKL